MSRSVETFRDVPDLAVWNVDVAHCLGVWEFSKSANDQGISGVEILLLVFQIVDELLSVVLDGNFVCQGCVVWIN